MNHFSEIIGQDVAISLLQSSIDKRQVSHAYLFIGPQGVGKKLTALSFAWQLIAIDDQDARIFWLDQVHPDLMIIEVQEKKTVITKEQITKEMEPWLALKPYRAKHRIVIIKDSHLMSDEAANALLKTLEEPPPYAVIILVADQSRLLETIVSRCQIIKFSVVTDHIIEQHLINKGVEATLALEVSKLAQGSVALAEQFIQDETIREKWDQAREMIKDLSSRDVAQIFTVAEAIDKDTELFTNMLETILRDILIYKTTKQETLVVISDNIILANNLKIDEINQLRAAINKINQLKRNYRRHVNSMLISVNIAKNIWQAFH
ncbi:MAG TPA: hypothetical protein VFC73_02330 [Syntrophomonadaceae bacterium]|nr:hypothetical protein [Syntrophomonadaceae bacterium]